METPRKLTIFSCLPTLFITSISFFNVSNSTKVAVSFRVFTATIVTFSFGLIPFASPLKTIPNSPSPNFTPRAGEEASSHHLDEVLWGCCHRESGSDVCGTVQTSEEPENIKTDSKEPQVIKSKKHSHKHVH